MFDHRLDVGFGQRIARVDRVQDVEAVQARGPTMTTLWPIASRIPIVMGPDLTGRIEHDRRAGPVGERRHRDGRLVTAGAGEDERRAWRPAVQGSISSLAVALAPGGFVSRIETMRHLVLVDA